MCSTDSSSNYCYILINDCDHKTYNGYTNNPTRRLRQHNGDIKGGAKFTTRRLKSDGVFPREWEYLVIIEAPGMTQRQALSLEWHIKYPTNRRPRPKMFNGAHGRLASLPLALGNRKFAGMAFVVHVLDRYYKKAREVFEASENTVHAYGATYRLLPASASDMASPVSSNADVKKEDDEDGGGKKEVPTPSTMQIITNEKDEANK